MPWLKNKAAHLNQKDGSDSRREISEAERIKLKFEAIWKARESELNAVRERTMIVWGFLMFSYGGYGYLFSRLFEHSFGTNRFRFLNIALLFFALLCWRLSAYWVEMAKGAEAWAEIYDYIAEAFQHVFLELKNPKRDCPRDKFSSANNLDEVFKRRDCKCCSGDVSHACLFSLLPMDTGEPNLDHFPDFDHCLFTTKGGAFSPAKTMIVVARLSLVISLWLSAVHTIIFIGGIEVVKFMCNSRWLYILFPIALFIFFFVGPLVRLVTRRGWAQRLFRYFVFDSGTDSMGLNHVIQVRELFSKEERS